MKDSNWKPKVVTCSAVNNIGIQEIWDVIVAYKEATFGNSYFDKNRNKQAYYWMYETINEKLKAKFYQSEKIKKLLPDFENKVLNEELSSFTAANELLKKYYSKK